MNDRWRLRVKTPDGSVRSIDLPRQGEWSVGRTQAADLQLADPSVSSTHAVLRWSSEQVEVRDQGSRFGTYLGDERLSSEWAPWRAAVPLWVGNCVLELAPAHAAAMDETIALATTAVDDSFASRLFTMAIAQEPDAEPIETAAATAAAPEDAQAEASSPPEHATSDEVVPKVPPHRRFDRLLASIGLLTAAAALCCVSALWIWVRTS